MKATITRCGGACGWRVVLAGCAGHVAWSGHISGLGRADGTVERHEDGERGLSVRTIKRRLSSVSGMFGYLLARGGAGIEANPVPYGLSTRRPGRRRGEGPALIKTPRTLPRVLDPGQASAFPASLHTPRGRALALGMLLGGLRRREGLALHHADGHPGTP